MSKQQEKALTVKNSISSQQEKIKEKILKKPFQGYHIRIFILYVIHNVLTKIIYVGWSGQGGRRLDEHLYDIMHSTHSNGKLNKDCKDIISRGFQPADVLKFKVVKYFPVVGKHSTEYITYLEEKFKKLERIYIRKLFNQGKQIYNVNLQPLKDKIGRNKKQVTFERDESYVQDSIEPKDLDFISKATSAANAIPCFINGIYFPSLTAAGQYFKINGTTVRDRIHSNHPKWKDWEKNVDSSSISSIILPKQTQGLLELNRSEVEPQTKFTRRSHNSKPCKIESRVYFSRELAAKALNIDISTVRRRLKAKRPEWRNWQNIELPIKVKSEEKKKKQAGKAKLFRGVKYKDKMFPSISSCKKETKLSTSTITNRCNDPYDNDFSWRDNSYLINEQTKVCLPVSVSANGKIFSSLSNAMRYFELPSVSIVKKRCENKSPKWKDWYYVK